MSLKSLMASRAKQITHPLARYSGTKLSCSLCGVAIKHENLFSSHLATKAHRTRAQQDEQDTRKRRAREEEELEREAKRAREDDDEEEESALPADFFSDPSMHPPAPRAEKEEPEEEPAEEEVDDEWASFEATLAVAPPPTTVPSAPSATISAAPVAYEFGAAKVLQEGEQAEEADEDAETAEDKAQRLLEERERDEREEIMERIFEEEREQTAADAKVTALKLRLEAIRAGRKK